MSCLRISAILLSLAIRSFCLWYFRLSCRLALALHIRHRPTKNQIRYSAIPGIDPVADQLRDIPPPVHAV